MLTTSPTLLDRLRLPNQPEAWARFVHLYTPLMLTWAQRQGLQEADAADLAQDVLIKLVRLLPTYEKGNGQSFRGWLNRVTANQCRDFRRRRATRALPTADGLSGADDESPVAELEEVEYRQAIVRRGLELIRPDFSEKTWKAFTGLMLDGRTAAEVATQLGMTENAVYMARHKVLTRLREEIGGLIE
ncbi:RNA polymerase sigma factor [Fimbriiglobus ruber]|uniref:Putative ECF sigma factor n=1 Tax=Fimbriiglobus ruber TaxID=1908690 RepID=A0A225DGV5_9BACT|nr:sigma-70 family RNA polymerase sigma factor [Fimbriiglobus ruber]OWK36409.1 putative ECF sigma factor [Fimbriiglobus ruber]